MCEYGHTAWTLADRVINADAGDVGDEATAPVFPLYFPAVEQG